MEEPQFKPYIGGEQSTKEFTLRAVILGIILGFIFAVGNAYLGLKIGMTISASIPAAVILEHNLVQTMASVGEAIAASVIFVFPAFFFLGLTPSSLEIFLIILIGGVTGILFMIPMRRYVIVKEHGKLQFPEGTACAEILRAGEEKEHDGALVAGFGLLIGAVYKFFVSGIKLFEETIKFNLFKPNGVLTLEATPSLIGVGFIIGPRIASYMFAGGLMGWWILIPLISTFGVSDTIIYPASVDVDSLDSYGIWSNYIRYVGAGAVAVGGIFSLVKIAPIALSSVLEGFKDIFKGLKHSPDLPRTDRDIPMGFLILGSIVSIFLIWALPIFQMNLVSVIITVILAFFFTGVVSITVGLVGSSTNPTSGMLICSLLISCTLFFVLGWTEKIFLLMSLTSVAFISVAICLASATSQDLKTGYLLGATPAKLQIAEMIGLILPALVMGSILHLLNQAYGLGSIDLPAPQATLLSFIANGILRGDLPYIFVMIGIFLGLILAILRLPILPFAIGLYLPLDLSTTIMLGGLVHALIKKLGSASQKGVLAASGLVAGDACMGVLIALLSILGLLPNNQISIINETGSFFTLLGVALILGLMAYRKK
jgi:putative OPT family oligopeptide transporter